MDKWLNMSLHRNQNYCKNLCAALNFTPINFKFCAESCDPLGKTKKDNYGIFLPLYRTKLQLSHKVRIFFQNSIFGYQEEGPYSCLGIYITHQNTSVSSNFISSWKKVRSKGKSYLIKEETDIRLFLWVRSSGSQQKSEKSSQIILQNH